MPFKKALKDDCFYQYIEKKDWTGFLNAHPATEHLGNVGSKGQNSLMAMFACLMSQPEERCTIA